jgi:hypothetical protein
MVDPRDGCIEKLDLEIGSTADTDTVTHTTGSRHLTPHDPRQCTVRAVLQRLHYFGVLMTSTVYNVTVPAVCTLYGT